MTSEDGIPESHWKILQEREQLHAQGLDQAIPVDEAFRQIREALRQDKILRAEGDSGLTWPGELLAKRQAALDCGESRALPLEEVAGRLWARRAARS